MEGLYILPHEAKVLATRPRINGLFAGSTADYGSIVDMYQPILQYEPFIDIDNEFGIQAINGIIHMTKEEFDKHNLRRSLYKLMRIFLPTDSELEASKRFLMNRKLMYKLHAKRKALP